MSFRCSANTYVIRVSDRITVQVPTSDDDGWREYIVTGGRPYLGDGLTDTDGERIDHMEAFRVMDDASGSERALRLQDVTAFERVS